MTSQLCPLYLNPPHSCRFRCTPVTSAVLRRHHRRRLLKYSPSPTRTSSPIPSVFKLSDDSIQINLKPPPLTSLRQFQTRLRQLLDDSLESFDDLKTVITVDNRDGGGVVITCKRSIVDFFVAILLSSFVIIFTSRALFKLRKYDGERLIYKRDRSLGGREVVVGKSQGSLPTTHKSAASSGENSDYFNQKKIRPTQMWGRRKEVLPQWWPQVLNSGSIETSNTEEYQRMANQLTREIMDRKMSGQDILADDIVQLRHICKCYGVRSFTDTENARDSLYRASINFVLNYCESISDISTSVHINGEDARDFIAGLADNIGLENTRAARMVSAAVAAHTRSRILQAWALEVQNKHSESLVELFKVCLIHRIFPPGESSLEMEMVARGLAKSLSVEQRELIFTSFSIICGHEMHQSTAEALGLADTGRSGRSMRKPAFINSRFLHTIC
ncbi:uncharacterized protein LOC142524297 isoform X1 [Primulina tabacum]|uniref:uncharacterized protein LOC142524297 isoform X1 n=2 Tax=Primulina tabacum TaxID=48773 RepID=UPI003F5A0E9F